MTIRTKTILSTGLALSSMVAVLCLLSRFLLLSGFNELEQNDALANVNRVRSIFISELAVLERDYADWSSWDDVYAFIKDKNPRFISSNLADETFATQKISVMAFVDLQGRIVCGKSFDVEHGRPVAMPPDLLEQIAHDKPLLSIPLSGRRFKGFVSLRQGPMMLVSQPILTSKGTGPTRGVLLVGRFISHNEILELARVAHRPLHGYVPGDLQMPEQCLGALLCMTRRNPTTTRIVDSDSMDGFTVFYDLYGKPCLLVTTGMGRPVYKLGSRIITYLLLALIGAGVVFCALDCFLMDRLVISRLAVLNRTVAGVMDDLAKRPAVRH